MPSTFHFSSPDINPIEKYWRRMKQALHRRKRQPITEAEMEAIILEKWETIS
jgi:hypothetical protein